MSTLELMVGVLFGVWIAGILLSQFFRRATGLIYALPSFIALVISINIAWLTNQTGVQTIGWNWFTIGNTDINLIFEFNTLTIPLMIIVSAISFLVHAYSTAYMKNDAAKPRFFATLGLFTFSMLGLTLSGNLLQLFMFWESVGLCSYLLIGFYRSKTEASAAATKAMIMNKIGDAGFLIALMILWAMAGTLSIESLTANTITEEWRTLIGTAILIAVLAKSAQFPFHTWLPDAMAGPTPVSALIHSATMVAAGVFLLARLQFLFTPLTLQVLTILGGITALIGGLNAIRENDLKRFLAWSTLSQLGLMVMVAGSGAFHASFVHLLSHAIFKAGLFLAVGVFIQHYRIKTFNESSPATTTLKVMVIVLTAALMGMPLTIGFLSKEALISSTQSPMVGISIYVLNFVTAFYCARLLHFIRSARSIEKQLAIPLPMLIAVTALATASLWIFYSLSPLHSDNINQIFQLTSPSFSASLLSVVVIFFGLASASGFIRQGKLTAIQKGIPSIPFDQLLKVIFVKPALVLSDFAARTDVQIDRGIHAVAYTKVAFAHVVAWTDKYFVDVLPHGVAWLSKAIGNLFRKLVTGKIQDYIWWTVAAIILMLIITLN
jgi:NADH-quinone oxidoreductase subunit L